MLFCAELYEQSMLYHYSHLPVYASYHFQANTHSNALIISPQPSLPGVTGIEKKKKKESKTFSFTLVLTGKEHYLSGFFPSV